MTTAGPEVTGEAFDDSDVVDCYRHRPPYPAALIEALAGLAVDRTAVLDLGCGPGKLAGPLAAHFERVEAVDPSEPMLSVARADHPTANIRWIAAPAETAPWRGPFGLAVGGASLHWMDPAALFPRLLVDLTPGAPVAIVDGDGPGEPVWKDDYIALLARWVERFGETWNSPRIQARAQGYMAWIDLQGRESFTQDYTTTIDSFLTCEHSRATWTHRRMGRLAGEFDADLRDLLAPHTVGGTITYPVTSQLAWGRVREQAR